MCAPDLHVTDTYQRGGLLGVGNVPQNNADNKKITYLYGTHENRVKSVETETTNGQTTVLRTRYYFGNYELLEQDGTTRHIYYLGGDGLNAIVMHDEAAQADAFNYYYTYTDHPLVSVSVPRSTFQ